MKWLLLLWMMTLPAASAACKSEPWESQELGLRLQKLNCDGAPARELRVLANTIRLVTPGQDPARARIVIAILDKAGRQKIQEAIFQAVEPDFTGRQKVGCEVAVADSRFPLDDPAKQVFQILPSAIYRAEAERLRAADPGAEVCGPYGETPTPQYFEFHPAESKLRYLFVRTGENAQYFDPKSLTFTRK